MAGCWSLRQGRNGQWQLDGGGGPAPDPAPVTTIAWRLGQLGGMAVGGFATHQGAEVGLLRDLYPLRPAGQRPALEPVLIHEGESPAACTTLT